MDALAPLKKTKFLSRIQKSNSNINMVRSNKREISIIQEVKENNPKNLSSKSPFNKKIFAQNTGKKCIKIIVHYFRVQKQN